MSASPQFISSLHWVQSELTQSLDRVRGLVERYMEQPSNQLPLQQAVVELHQVRGTAAMIQCSGVAALCEEMKLALQDLMQDRVREKEPAYAALLGAAVQLGDYIDVLASGQEDSVLVFQPAINELRLARGKPVLTEAELFGEQFAALAPPVTLPPSQARAPGAASALAKKYLLVFQQSLVSWLKNQDVQLALGRLGKVAEQVAAAATRVPVYQLWRALAAVVEALLTRGVQDGAEIKRLFGRAGTLLKMLAEQGEEASAAGAAALSYQLLFHVGRSQSQGPRVSALKKAYDLPRALPSGGAIDALRQKIRGPNTQLLNRLSEEIRKDLGQVKDSIDLIVRAGDKAPADLKASLEKLRRVADTLNMLGLSALQGAVQNEAQRLGAVQPGKTAANDPVWLEVATALLRVEHGLNDALARQLRGARGEAAAEGAVPLEDIRAGREALVRELLQDLARLKSRVDDFLRSGNPAGLGEAGRILADLQSGFRILGSDRASELVSQLEKFVRSGTFPALRQNREPADRFADAIACVEYYLEAVQRREAPPEHLIDNLASYVEKLDIPEQVAVQDSRVFKEPLLAPPVAAPPPVAETEVDPEIRSVFVEEAGEVLLGLRQRLPELRRDSQNKEALTDIRRAFHTLKGSGRMVGARAIGELGWAVENMLNHCLDGRLALSPAVMHVVDDAVARLPALVDAFRQGRPADEATGELMERAHRLSKGESEGPDTETIATFSADARERVQNIRNWVAEQDRAQSDFAVPAEVVREFHTLRGAATLAHAEAIHRLSGAFEAYLDALRGADLRLPSEGLALLAEVAGALADWVERVARREPVEPDAKPLMRRLEEVQAALPAAAVDAAAERAGPDVFANEAFTQLEAVEAAARDWAERPDDLSGARTLQRLFQRLHGDADTARCAALGRVARALEERLERFAGENVSPAPGFFRALAALVEGMYQQLDAFREGRLQGDGSDLVARAQALAPDGAMEEAPAEPAAALPEAAEAVEEVIDIPPVEPMETSADPELQALFQAEAEELLESIDRQFDAWERRPDATEPLGELARALHTLKGGARMANVMAMGNVAHRFETLLSQVGQGEVKRDRTLFARMHNVVDGLHAMLDALRRGQPPDPGPALAELEGLSGEAAPAEAPLAEPEVIEMPPVAEEADTGGAPEAPAGFDAELAEVFAGEAAELLEQLEASLATWQSNPGNTEARHQVQRALHTFKGGARMAGLMAMGSAAHEMESRVEKIERGVLATDPAQFAQLHSELETLQRLHDRLARGEGAKLVREGPVPAAAEAPPEPTVEHFELPTAPPAPARAVPARESLVQAGWDPALFWTPAAEEETLSALRRETARVAVEQLDKMLNEAGEISIYRSRLEQHNNALQFQLQEMVETIGRVREHLRAMDIETEAQIAARGFSQGVELDRERYAEFDPLEMDRYSRMQELSRALAEDIGDLAALHNTMDGQLSEADTLLLQQGRVNTEVQQGLMGTLMVPFSRQVQRLQRVVRQAAADAGKQAEATFEGVEQEMDRKVLERMVAPLEHLLRNAVVHGIEPPEARAQAGKPAAGRIRVSLRREGSQLAITLADDGRGLDYQAIRRTAVKRGLMPPDAELRDEEVAMFIFEPGFSTASELTQAAGRGVGMDVVASEVKQLGGTLELASETGKGTRFLIRLPLTLALSQALLVGSGPEVYAISLPSVESIVRLPKAQLENYLREDGPPYTYGDREYRVRLLSDFVDTPPQPPAEDVRTVPAVLVRLGEGLGGGERRAAVVVDALLGNREIVSKAVGPQISSVQGISGATILPDGRVVLILDLPQLLADRARRAAATVAAEAEAEPGAALADERPQIMVVDDSITIRRVTERLLDKHGYRVLTAKDGLEAIAMLQTEAPDAVLLDIEMPRADGFEVAAFIRNSERLGKLPIVMITSRSGEKHREHARQLGVNRYVIKPYHEEQLIGEVRGVLREKRR